jgi:hypothetical protein
LIAGIPGFHQGKETDIGNIRSENVQGCDLNEDQRAGIKELARNPVIESTVKVKDKSTTLL